MVVKGLVDAMCAVTEHVRSDSEGAVGDETSRREQSPWAARGLLRDDLDLDLLLFQFLRQRQSAKSPC